MAPWAGAEEWYDAYGRGLLALKQREAKAAVAGLNRAIQLRRQPGENLLTYGTNTLRRYYPYLRLADATRLPGDPTTDAMLAGPMVPPGRYEVELRLGDITLRQPFTVSKDPRVRGAGLITVTHVRVSGDLRHARALFTVHDLDRAGLERVRQGLDNASGYFRMAISRRLRMKVAPAVSLLKSMLPP